MPPLGLLRLLAPGGPVGTGETPYLRGRQQSEEGGRVGLGHGPEPGPVTFQCRFPGEGRWGAHGHGSCSRI